MNYLNKKWDTLFTLLLVFGPTLAFFAFAIRGGDPIALFGRLVGMAAVGVVVMAGISAIFLLLGMLRR
jgi:hypothetical protein